MTKEKLKNVRTSRNVLWYITFIGFAVNYMYRVNVNIAIVDMIQATTQTTNKQAVTAQCFEEISNTFLIDEYQMINGTNTTISNNKTELIAKKFNINYSLERLLLNKFDADIDEKGFKWDEYQQGLVLGAFFWLHWLTQIPGGILARKYGTKLIFGLSNLISCSLCFIMPICSYWDYRALIFLRVLQGFISGLSWPAMHNMTALWIPPNERSNFITAYLGSSIGIAIFYPFFGFIISWSSWEWVFHISGIIGIIWYILWHFLIYDSPALHPRIDPVEREYIEKSLGTSIQNEKISTPWKEILADRAVWMIVIAQWGNIWGLFTYMTQAPTYFKYIHGWSMQMTGILSGLPYILRLAFAYAFSHIGDYLLRTNKMSRTNVRKMAGIACLIINGCLSIGLAYSGCNAIAAIVFLNLASAFAGAVSTGPLANAVDTSPNYASIIMGLSSMIAVIPGFISPIIVGILTLNNQTITQWKYVFLISAGMLIVSGILYFLFGNADVKDWNNPKKNTSNKELDQLKPNLEMIKETIILEENEEDLEPTFMDNDKNNSVLLVP